MRNNNIKYLIALSLIFISVHALCLNERDSLLKQLNISVETEKAAILVRLSELFKEDNLDKSNEYALMALEFATKYNIQGELFQIYNQLYFTNKELNNDSLALTFIFKQLDYTNDIKEFASIYKKIGMLYWEKGQFILTENYFLKQLDYTIESRDSLLIANNYFNLAYVNLRMEKYNQAHQYYNNALLLYQYFSDSLSISNVYNDLGIVCRNLKSYDEALEYFEGSLLIKKSLNHEAGIANIYNNMGNVYWDMRKLNEALKYYNYSLDIRRKLNLDDQIISTLNNIANIYANKKDQFRAIFYYKEAYKLAQKQNDNYIHCVALLNLGIAYNKVNQFDKSYYYINKSLVLINEINSEELKQSYYGGLNNYYYQTKQYKKAYEIYKKYSIIATKRLETLYDNQAKEYEMKIDAINNSYNKYKNETQAVIEQDKRSILYLTVSTTLLSILTIIGFTLSIKRYFKSKNDRDL